MSDMMEAGAPATHGVATHATSETETGLWARLKAGTRPTHERLDDRIMQARPFESRERYGMFVLVQHDFFALVSPLYQHEQLAPLLPDLAERDRLAAIEADLADLGIAVPVRAVAAPEEPLDIAQALGWLYVAEGSNLGAAFLLKAAKGLDLSEEFGAHHLAAAPEGRGLHWKTFTAGLDALALTAEEEARVIAGSNAAFSQVRQCVEARMFGGAAN